MTSPTERRLAYLVVTLFAAASVYPLISIVQLSLQPQGTTLSSFSLPDELAFGNFRDAWNEGFGPALRSSFLIAAVVAVVSAFFSMLAAYAFALFRWRGSTILFLFLLVGLVAPYEGMVIPLYYDLKAFGLTNTYWALILPQIALSVSFGTFWLRSFFTSVPSALVDAAKVDGANSWTTLWRVLFPQAKPALTVLLVLLFIFTWNEFLLALVMIQDVSIRTAPVVLADFTGSQRGITNLPLTAAAALIVAAPVLAVYVALQRSFISGLLAGAVKE
ncbi:MAG: ABC transporter, permease protein 2 (cluster 1, maltose/g3p/polyamine/iron) [uncultured Thermoleophilia bacterium]|uniref:ABC transporter, permease protein 2 (Cluster 1, maltose/g3p/polyamine/iron) n=1 Tax=uncultured Thermoleophilia bacterium TaxID=1497501 RepID=A0A6J4U7Q1_9ACTN|nr:MAG: ABC transporter, permease protein 2 (cluster 1, maltose/g3p/polyamine/iron) [uncultured Thermoleophilia bacterium]